MILLIRFISLIGLCLAHDGIWSRAHFIAIPFNDNLIVQIEYETDWISWVRLFGGSTLFQHTQPNKTAEHIFAWSFNHWHNFIREALETDFKITNAKNGFNYLNTFVQRAFAHFPLLIIIISIMFYVFCVRIILFYE